MEAQQMKSVIERALVSFVGQTTGNGNVGGTTVVCSTLTGYPNFDGQQVVIASGTYAGQVRDIDGDTTTGTVTVTPALGGQIVSGVNFYILTGLPMSEELADVLTYADPKVMGRAQIAATTIDLNQAAATYDLFTGTTQVVILESLNIKMPTGNCGGALTSISIQTDDATPGVIISAAEGAVANLTSEADLGWTGTLYITVGTKIRLTIAGGAHGAAYVCNVTAKCRAVVSGGYLA